MNPKNNYINNLMPSNGYNSIGLQNISAKPKVVNTTSTVPQKTYLESTNNPSVATNTAATNPSPMKPSTPTLPPVGQQFVNNLVTKPSINTQSSVTQNNQQPTQTTTPTQPESPYLKYLNSLFDADKTNKALKQSTEANERLANIQSRNEKQSLDSIAGREKILDTPGGLRSGAQDSAAMFSRRANAESAYGAIEESAAARTAAVYKDTFDTLIGAGKTVFEAETEAKKAAQEQTNFDKQQKLAEEKFEEDKRQFGEQMALERYKATAPKPLSAAQEAKQIADQEKEVAAQQQASQSIGLVNNLLNGDRYKAISGGIQTGSIPFLGDRAAVNEYNQLTGLMKLGIRGLLKGQGAVSDYEGKVLGQASSALSRLTDENQFKEALQTVRGVLKTNNGQVTTVEVTNPQTGEKVEADLSGAEIYQLTSEGNIITYK